MRWLVIAIPFSLGMALPQQTPNIRADVEVEHPRYQPGEGPLLAIDGTHNNFHTAKTGYYPAAKLLENDGFRVRSLEGKLTHEGLGAINVLVIVDPRSTQVSQAPAAAFSPEEVAMIGDWVREGGALLLIADHMPFPSAIQPLATRFGYRFENSVARAPRQGPELFSAKNGGLPCSPVRNGNGEAERVTRVYSFEGSSFRAPADAIPVLRFPKGWKILYPEKPWQFKDVPSRPADPADLRGAISHFGKGRVAVFSEAAMFTAQNAPSGVARGFAFDGADQNKQFLLNVAHWLATSN